MIDIPKEYTAYEICHGCACHGIGRHTFDPDYSRACERARGKYAALTKGGHRGAWAAVIDAGNLCISFPADDRR